MNDISKNICIFASSSDMIERSFFKSAYELGMQIGMAGYNVVYGGSTLGLMGEVTAGARRNGSDIIGVMPEKLYNMGISSGDCTKFILTKGMRERKEKMDKLSSALIALPGGFGTLEELSEMIVQKQIGYNNKPIVIYNTNGYYDKLIEFFEKIIEKNFASKISNKLFFITDDPKQAVDYIKNYSCEQLNYLKGKIRLKN